MSITAKEVARHASSFINYDIFAIDNFYDGFLQGPVVDERGKRFYASMMFEDMAENPDHKPERQSSKAMLYYRIFALYELTEEEWNTWDEAHDFFVEIAGSRACVNCSRHERERSGGSNVDLREYYDSDLKVKHDEMVESLNEREPASWTMVGKYFDKEKALLE